MVITLTNAVLRLVFGLQLKPGMPPLNQNGRSPPGLNPGGGTKPRDWPRGTSVELKHQISVSAIRKLLRTSA